MTRKRGKISLFSPFFVLETRTLSQKSVADFALTFNWLELGHNLIPKQSLVKRNGAIIVGL